MYNPQDRQQPMYPPQFPGQYPMGHGQQHRQMQPGMQHPQAFGAQGFRQQMPIPFQQPPYPRPFLHSFRTQEGSLDYNKIFAVIDQSVKVAQQISPIFSAFKKK
ncbi:YppG family protein [Fictibacillus nanhaiensis]|uniref:YppG family protein n=1 Tax=Fictibacillus nanhaiensis TaxID=742169 RepID=UPI001C9829A2|nr:YppG family protein [Fictibacillus nanhaiensis]MBY6036337.1 YppG family protein [Fictibacillus nanhaiensis]